MITQGGLHFIAKCLSDKYKEIDFGNCEFCDYPIKCEGCAGNFIWMKCSCGMYSNLLRVE